MPETLIVRRKLRVPLLPPGHLRRERLLEALKPGCDRQKRLTLVHGSPGFGKSTLVADYAGWAGMPVVWYNLAEGDGDVLVFLEHLVAALVARFPDVSAEPLALVRSAPNPANAIGNAIGLLCEELSARGRGPFLLVLDDFHAIENAPGIREAAEALIEYFLHDAQLVVISRTQPALNVPRLRVRQQLAELGPAELKFDRAEIGRLFQDQAGLALDEVNLDAVSRQTEGWIASVLLSVRAGLPLKPADLTEQLEEYLLQEVYDRQEPEIKRFLQGACLLPQIEAGLCADVLGCDDPRRLMAAIWERNLFVNLASAPDGAVAYQFHPIFRGFLRDRAKAEWAGADLRELHRRIAERLLAEAPSDALDHFVAAGDTAAVLAHLEPIGWELLRSQRFESLAQLLARLPADLTGESAGAQLLGGEVQRARGDFDGALESYARARQLGETGGDDRHAGLALALTAAVLGARGDARVEETAERALAILPTAEAFGRAMALNALGARRLFTDRTEEALGAFEEALGHYRDAGDSAGQARVLHNKGLAHVRLGRFTPAVADYRDSIRLSERGGRWALPMTFNNLAVVWGYLGQFDQALEDATKALDLARQLQARRDEAFVLWTLAEIHLRRGHLREAQDYFGQSRDAAIALGDRPSEAMALAGTASLELAEGRADRALALLRQALELRGHREGDPTLGDLVYPLAK
ncbi:MAG: tetratricopeptide repeat protein, partial [Candidatus Sericytochromatia bacterium]|nr:tetratricopeptide repeat protein [Candidatus Tanganyikabacteria bacterium]